MASDLAERHGIGVRWGCHCAHLLVKRVVGIPRPLEQFQGLIVRLFPRLNLPRVVRVSFGIENTAADVDAPAEALRDLARQPRDGAAKDAKQQMDQFAKAVSERVYSLPDLSTS